MLVYMRTRTSRYSINLIWRRLPLVCSWSEDDLRTSSGPIWKGNENKVVSLPQTEYVNEKSGISGYAQMLPEYISLCTTMILWNISYNVRAAQCDEEISTMITVLLTVSPKTSSLVMLLVYYLHIWHSFLFGILCISIQSVSRDFCCLYKSLINKAKENKSFDVFKEKRVRRTRPQINSFTWDSRAQRWQNT